ncbi:hypothetical protein K2173_026051 [Erythroxylum novogranatense]|uniref:Uncharacterized protein n=1 Tax=Erythroxylum novogranatense TaxID=1862640 RepID=A0AAV8SIH5_9ROSI|nr:hypothetical protein K2173_026051 [Erythroxylum novogranatense]
MSSPSSLRDKLRSTICCFLPSNHHEVLEKMQSPKEWPEIRDRCRTLIGTTGKNRRRYKSTDFRYDLQSYWLNFEDDISREDDLLLNNFTARLPDTPVRLADGKWVEVTLTKTGVAGWS